LSPEPVGTLAHRRRTAAAWRPGGCAARGKGGGVRVGRGRWSGVGREVVREAQQ
jgi:hypothetical protein